MTMAKRKSAAVGVLVLLSVLLAAVGQVSAQGQEVRLGGRVQWIAGQLMVVQLASGGSVSVDLKGVPQDQYSVLRRGDRVVIGGALTDLSPRFMATSVVRAGDVSL
jgi:hypothetical protein